ncbi:hypothetical protein CIB93_16185 [Streptomyces sp. WZ.A104]|uniref:hypothetical protein n=1 Tax=Streptomyces sp. WZ.A104 TaxID=2023771 RepID=UPI000BBC49F8|nr:hypothetical protein [Streptomyces sp. WZ.A104]PCG85052.1 hypothetical protein CIB93_16185 [Streptomyces sp. WZ.A104]
MTHAHEPEASDYRIDGFEAATEAIEEDFYSVTISDDMFVPLAEHHSDDGRDSYLLFYDQAATWDIPGTAEYVAFHLTRDTEQRTFTFAYERAPIVPLAQNWLVRRGCPPAGTVPTRNHGPGPADALTSHLEDLLRTNPDGRYEVIDHHTENLGSFDFGSEVRTLVYDSHPDSAHAPYRLFLEETAKDFHSYTLREGAFTGAEAADAWVKDRSAPLPQSPAPESTVVHRAQAARTRSPLGGAAGLAVPAGTVTASHPTSPSVTRSGRGAR